MKKIVALSALLLTACGSQAPAPVVNGYGYHKANTQHVQKASSPQDDMVTSALDEFTLNYVQDADEQNWAAPQNQMPPQMYVVKRGDTVGSIARAHRVSEEELRSRNNLAQTEILAINQEIKIPNAQGDSPNSGFKFTQVDRSLPQANPVIEAPVVQNSAESLEDEAMAAAASVLATQPKTPLQKPVIEKPKTLAKVEKKVKQISPKKTHVVKSGENIFRIGLKYGVSQFDIMAANDIEKPQSLKVGQKLVIPAKGEVEISEIAPAAGPEHMPLKPAYLTKKHRAKGLIWPAEGKVIKRFGKAGEGVNNTGINILLPKNSPIMAADDGKVIYSDNGLESYGNLILIRHKNGLVTAYAHNERNVVKRHEKVRKGQVIGFAGATGNVNQSQLHFEVRKNSQAINPVRVLPKM